jgi:ABC-type Fe3+-citrate transport system substrate-binding protein
MKQDLELDFQAKLLNKEREWSKKLADKEKNISHLRDDNKMLQQSNEDMKYVFLAQIS